jgi:hypothetical protein
MHDTRTQSPWNRSRVRTIAIPPLVGFVASLAVLWVARATRIGPLRHSNAEAALLMFVFVFVASMTQGLNGRPTTNALKQVTLSFCLALAASAALYLLALWF